MKTKLSSVQMLHFAFLTLATLLLPLGGLAAPARLLSTSSRALKQSGTLQRIPESAITDKGYSDRPRGWYDANCNGALLDYCRYVGDAPNIFWSCALGNSDSSTKQYTAPGQYTEAFSSLQPCSPVKRPRMTESLITDKGYSDRPRGWYDAECQGVANSYCRYVGDAPNVFWSCTATGVNATQQYSEPGKYTEATTSKLPCSPARPRMAESLITDKGYSDRPRGWYDAECQGAANNYCRYVGDYPSVFWSCTPTGTGVTNQYSPPGQYIETKSSLTPCSPAKRPRMAESLITDKGYSYMARGWYDAECQGAANNYCRYVGDSPNIFWSCSATGVNATEQYSPRGKYSQGSTSQYPC